MYRLSDPVLHIKGVGQSLHQQLLTADIRSVLDLLLFLPRRYEDRSQMLTLQELPQHPDEIVTVKAEVLTYKQYYKGRLLISRAQISDQTGQINCLWFNNRFLKNQLRVGGEYFFAGKYQRDQLAQPAVEAVKTATIHTGRLVPIYSALADIKQGSLRRLQAEVLGKLQEGPDTNQLFTQLHFPESAEAIIAARERLATEELITLMQQAKKQQHERQQLRASFSLPTGQAVTWPELPFQLSRSQEQAIASIMADLSQSHPMNRLLIGDVGSGKTITAALPAYWLVQQGQSAALIAPTKILAAQHATSLQQLLPNLPIELVTAGQRVSAKKALYIGTHALLNRLEELRPSLVIYDEQQRFGVAQRSIGAQVADPHYHPHRLSMTATPIPRSLMLTVFADLAVSYLEAHREDNQLRQTWLVPPAKQDKALDWLLTELSKEENQQRQALLVCPFIDPAAAAALENVAAVKAVHERLTERLAAAAYPLSTDHIGLLHSRLSHKQQQQVIERMYNHHTRLLVTTAMVEVGVDLPNADYMLIYSAERFGLSSLHQLRGRVGRRGQPSFCLLFSDEAATAARLHQFTKETDGLKLAELDLTQRGAGNLLGIEQSGFSGLRFASWTNTKLIKTAQQQLADNPQHKSFLTPS